MSDILLDEQDAPSTPSAGKGVVWVDNIASILCHKDDAGRVCAWSRNASIAQQGAGFASDTYVTDSDILIPAFGLQAKTVLLWQINFSKTAAGIAAPTYTVRIGANRTTADASRVAVTAGAQTAVVDDGILMVQLVVRNIGAAGVLNLKVAWAGHHAAGTGFGNGNGNTGAGFDMTALAGQYIGLSINAGASAAWTTNSSVAMAMW
jgi:hypothetical protein